MPIDGTEGDVRRNGPRRYTAAMSKLWGSVAVLLLVSTPAAAQPPVHQSSIRVVASATVSMKPDRAELELGVTTDKKTAKEATAENDRKMAQVLAVLKKEVGAGDDVKTSQLNVSPRFGEGRRGEPSPLLGYTVTNTVAVRVADIKAVGRLLDAALAAGANTVERVQFTLKDPEAAQNEALRGAAAKARARATAMSDGLGLKVGPVLSLSEGDGESSPLGYTNLSARRRANVASMQIESGSVEVSATVTVVFALVAR
ncbi:MAG: hypothetical protein JWM82_3017 [Myxococcales bacterium]|nr:hypothetical protein [Myxococcales bacterium]